MENGTNTFLCHLLRTTIHMYNIRAANRLCGLSRSWREADRSAIFQIYACVEGEYYIWCFSKFIFVSQLFPIDNIFEVYYNFK